MIISGIPAPINIKQPQEIMLICWTYGIHHFLGPFTCGLIVWSVINIGGDGIKVYWARNLTNNNGDIVRFEWDNQQLEITWKKSDYDY